MRLPSVDGNEKCDMEIPMVHVYTTNLDEVMHADRLYDCLDGKTIYIDMVANFGVSGQLLNDRGVPIAAQ